MKGKFFAVLVAVVLLVAVGSKADDDEYHYLSICDSRCEMRNRLNPFAESCDNCCRVRGFRKGKCKGFGWQYCACKPHSPLRSLLNNILTGNLNNNNYGHGQGLNNVFQG